MLLALTLMACQGASSDGDAIIEPPSLSLAAAPVLDPVLGEPLDVSVTTEPGLPVAVTIVGPDEEEVARWEGSANAEGAWSERWEPGPLPTGGYTIRAQVEDLSAEQPLNVVRAGFVAAWAEAGEGLREPLYWGASRELQDVTRPFARLDGLDQAHFPALHENLYRAPEPGVTEPVAFTWDARPLLTLEVGESWAFGATGLDEVEVHVSVDGFTAISGLPLTPGTPVVLQADAPLGDGPGVFEGPLALQFWVPVDGEPLPIGEQRLPVRFYLLLGPSAFSGDAPKYRPWTGVIDPALRAIEGVPADHGAVLDALVAFVYHDLNLAYDVQAGASHYSTYIAGSWARPHFFLSEFLQRSQGRIINCTDAGNILAAYANMVGAPLDHVVLLRDFDLNEIKAIGRQAFTSCPFGNWGCGFSYHAVTTIDGGGTIWDATLAVDGDVDPGAAPSTELLVQGLTGEEYLQRLVRSGSPEYRFQAEVTLE